MSIVTIKEVKGIVRCAEDGAAEQVFNVKNATNKALKIGMQLSLSEPVREEWLKIDGPTERGLDVETMTQVSVKIQVPPDCAPGKYSYRLRVFDPDSPGEVYTDGDPVYFEVPAKKEVVIKKEDKGRKPFKWWIPLAIAVTVIVIGVVLWKVWPSGVKLPDFTQKDWNQAKAEEFLKKHNLNYTLQLQKDPDPRSEREILGQDPAPGSNPKKGEKITLRIAGEEVPPLVDKSLSSALQLISSAGLSFDADKDLKIQGVRQPNQHEKVLSQKPPPQVGKLVPKRLPVELTVGRLANKGIDWGKVASQVETMKGIKMSPNFITREVQPDSR
jgi:PASTA domain